MTKKKTVRKKRRTAKAPPAEALSQSVGWPWPLREYQQKVEDKFDAGIKKHLLIWHRRAGKDVFCLSKARQESMKRVGGYVHFFPKHSNARRAIWNGVDPKIRGRFIDHAFGDIEVGRNNTEMFIELANGSTWQLLGSDNYNNIVGSNIVGAVFSEWALCDPRAYDYIAPMIIENGGWVVFITTYRGRNHAYQMVQRLKDNPEWYVDVRDIYATTQLDGTPVFTPEQLDAERRDGRPEATLQEEYLCNPAAVQLGAIYGKQVESLIKDESRHKARWNPARPVYAVWNFDLPVFATCIYIQSGPIPTVLDAKTWEFVTLGEAVAASYRQPFPIQAHIIGGNQAEMTPLMADLDIYPAVQHSQSSFIATSSTANFINQCDIAMPKCEMFLDGLGGYVRGQSFSNLTADLVFSSNPKESTHCQIAHALETYAVWAYHSNGSTWDKAPDYSIQDRIAKTII